MTSIQTAARISSRTLILTLLASASLALAAGELLGINPLEVEKPIENIRSSPNGEQVGTLVKGTEVEELDREGKWVKISIEGWIWGPSLRGFEAGDVSTTANRREREAEKRSEVRQSPARPERANLHRYTANVAKIIDPDYGDFYGISLDRDLGQLVVRFRVRGISRDVLEVRQMRVQREVLRELGDEKELEFASIRIEVNRPDGSGEVGIEVAVANRKEIELEGDDVEQWKERTRLSTDGGSTWE